jgi:hypothetical protein
LPLTPGLLSTHGSSAPHHLAAHHIRVAARAPAATPRALPQFDLKRSWGESAGSTFSSMRNPGASFLPKRPINRKIE